MTVKNIMAIAPWENFRNRATAVLAVGIYNIKWFELFVHSTINSASDYYYI